MQYDNCTDELARAAERFSVRLHRFDEVDYFDDLDELSGLIMALDLVISAPTTVSVHAAALGIETWQMICGADWQTHGTNRNPWLPAIVRFERRWDQGWAPTINAIAGRLRVRQAQKT